MASVSLLEAVTPVKGIELVVYTHSNGKKIEKLASDVKMSVIECPDPVEAMMHDFQGGMVDAIIRGQLSSSHFLKNLKSTFSISGLYRLALLATHDGHGFFFAPVGIDEGQDLMGKTQFVLRGKALLEKLGVKPKIFVLSAGRLDDVGRSKVVKKSIEEAISLVEDMKIKHPGLDINHGEILIESAMDLGANLILAPDGISGNLIYRTLLHLGNGHSYGAYYLDERFPGPVIDTSRVGPPEEYFGAMVLALRLLA